MIKRSELERQARKQGISVEALEEIQSTAGHTPGQSGRTSYEVDMTPEEIEAEMKLLNQRAMKQIANRNKTDA